MKKKTGRMYLVKMSAETKGGQKVRNLSPRTRMRPKKKIHLFSQTLALRIIRTWYGFRGHCKPSLKRVFWPLGARRYCNKTKSITDPCLNHTSSTLGILDSSGCLTCPHFIKDEAALQNSTEKNKRNDQQGAIYENQSERLEPSGKKNWEEVCFLKFL